MSFLEIKYYFLRKKIYYLNEFEYYEEYKRVDSKYFLNSCVF